VLSGERIPAGFTVRAASADDAAAIADLINEVTVAEVGVPWTSEAEMRVDLTSPREAGTPPNVLLLDPEGSVAGYLQLYTSDRREFSTLAFVPPRYWGRGLSAWLISHGEAQALGSSEGSDGPVRVHVSRFVNNEPAERLFMALGYLRIRTFWVMRIELATAQPQPVALPNGIRIRTFEGDMDERAVYDVLNEAFADHWGSGFETFERWRHTNVENETFDPTMWFLALDGDQVVGTACCTASTPRGGATGEVDYLGVRRAWRRRGIARALLLRAFDVMRVRGLTRCELRVDAENITGATRVYERADMHVVYSWDVWEKSLRAGDGDVAS
jgi:mycothiol synthase